MTEPPIKRIKELERKNKQLEESNMLLMQEVDRLRAAGEGSYQCRMAVAAMKDAFDALEQEIS